MIYMMVIANNRSLFQIGGPIWLGPIHNQSFVSNLLCKVESMELGTQKRLEGVLNVIYEELETPLYYVLDRLVMRETVSSWITDITT